MKNLLLSSAIMIIGIMTSIAQCPSFDINGGFENTSGNPNCSNSPSSFGVSLANGWQSINSADLIKPSANCMCNGIPCRSGAKVKSGQSSASFVIGNPNAPYYKEYIYRTVGPFPNKGSFTITAYIWREFGSNPTTYKVSMWMLNASGGISETILKNNPPLTSTLVNDPAGSGWDKLTATFSPTVSGNYIFCIGSNYWQPLTHVESWSVDDISINYNKPSVSITKTPTGVVCLGNGCVTLTPTFSSGTSPYTYSWNDGSTQTVRTFCSKIDFVYTVTVTDALGCTSTASSQVIIDKPNAYLGQDITVCPGSCRKLAITCPPGNPSCGRGDNTGESYLWSPPTGLSCTTCPQPAACPTTTTTYTVTVTSRYGCTSTGKVKVNVFNPICPFDLDKYYCPLPAGAGVQIGSPAQPGVQYQWTPSSWLNCSTCPQPIASPPQYTVYGYTATLSYTDANGNFASCSYNNPSCERVAPDNNSCYAEKRNLAVTDKSNPGFSLFPNPSSGQMQFSSSLEEGQTGKLLIFDMMGKQLSSYPMAEGENTLNINESTLPDGIYFYRVMVNDQLIKTDKFSILK